MRERIKSIGALCNLSSMIRSKLILLKTAAKSYKTSPTKRMECGIFVGGGGGVLSTCIKTRYIVVNYHLTCMLRTVGDGN